VVKEVTVVPVEPTTEPAEIEGPVAVPDPGRARDVALAAIRENHADVVVPGGGWTEENVTEEGLVGASSVQYVAGEWVVLVSFPVVAPQDVIYAVIATDGAGGFRWEGQVTAGGRVTEMNVVAGTGVAFEGVRFSYDEALAGDVVAERVAGVGPEDVPEWAIDPAHIQFSFEGYVLPETFHEPRLMVYRASDIEAAGEMLQQIASDIRRVLEDRPAVPDVPALPPVNAGTLMRTQVRYTSFQNGTGVRFLTERAQAFVPISNYGLYYRFLGMTDDGRFYVSAILPVSHPSLPDDEAEIPGGDYDAFVEDYRTYAEGVEQSLGAQDASSFTPDLALLDGLIGSLVVGAPGE
jgi:hypothetical protein